MRHVRGQLLSRPLGRREGTAVSAIHPEAVRHQESLTSSLERNAAATDEAAKPWRFSLVQALAIASQPPWPALRYVW